MTDLSLKLSAFEGPLDLLMHLIERDKIDIYDIPIVSITEQYISYLRNLSEFDMELASEFLVMAATLLQIKSRMLLPKEAASEVDELDPRQQLVEMLVEYRKIKRAAAALGELKAETERYFSRRPMFADLRELVYPRLQPSVLLEALASMVTETGKPAAYIEPQAFSVQEKMSAIMEAVRKRPGGFLLSELFSSGYAGEKVAAFLGVLELLKMGLITISQHKQFAPIYIFAKQGEQEHVL